ncbi:cytochrome c4 [Thiomicrorhabdus sp. HH1]|uniref:Cytochrome c4 n=2 Tax=Piscirickettsiaceae TaxID=135616 RepID=A0ABS0BWB2_9GAMM|nr:cytochrome c4 [Thiomicrorhabdus heinhorstiae]
MKKIVLFGALSLGVAYSMSALASEHGHAAKAEPWTLAKWDQTAANLPGGNAAKGEALHKNNFCMACHGAEGVAPSRNAPSLAGNTVEYTYKTLKDYQSTLRNEGNGKSAVMITAAQTLSDQDIADLAAYYASQVIPAKPTPMTVDPAIELLVRKGDFNRMITPCASCHGAHGEGKDITPALAGQTPEYFVRTMHAYKNGHRTNDINEGMSQFTHDLTDAEIEALAEYYASLSKQ